MLYNFLYLWIPYIGSLVFNFHLPVSMTTRVIRILGSRNRKKSKHKLNRCNFFGDFYSGKFEIV